MSVTKVKTAGGWVVAAKGTKGDPGDPSSATADDIVSDGPSTVQDDLDTLFSADTSLSAALAAKLSVTGTKVAGLIPKVQGDLSVAWDTDSTGGGGGGGAVGDRIFYVYASGESGATGSYICDGTADEVQINNAIAAAAASNTIGRGTNGGIVVLVGRRFTIAGPILMKTQVRLTSMYGEMATQVRCHSSYAPGSGSGMIELDTTDVQYVEVDNLTLDGQGYSVCGLFINEGTGQEYDAYHKFHNLYIWNVGQDGISMQNNSGGRLRGCQLWSIRVINAGRYGCYVNGPDSFYTNIDIGSSGSHGFYIAHANNRFFGCKSWYSDGSGYYFTTSSRDNQLTACESQDNQFHGYHIQGARNSFAACCADSNSYDGSSGTITGRSYHGFYVAGNYTNVHGTASDKNEGGRGARQVYGVQVAAGVTCICNVTTTGNYTGSLSNSGTMSGFVVGT